MYIYKKGASSHRQNRRRHRTAFHRQQPTDDKLSYCRFFCLMCVCKVADIFARRTRKMKLHYQVLSLLGLTLLLLCLSRILTNFAKDDLTFSEVQRNVQSISLPEITEKKGETAEKPHKPAKPVYEKAPVCGNRWPCQVGHVGFNLKAGLENKDKPYVCFNNKDVFKDEDSGRGLNFVVIDAKVKDVVITRHVDTYVESPSTLVEFLSKIAPGDVLVAVTADDAYRKLSKEIMGILRQDFHSLLIDELRFRSAWVFVGQKGVRSSVSLEKLNKVHGHWPEKTELRGCLSLPMNTNASTIEQRRDSSNNCNLPECSADTFPISVVNGGGNSAVRPTPTVCIDGKEVMTAKKINDYEPGKRGLNCFIFDVPTMKVVNVGRFDTYTTSVDDTLLQKFLASIEDGQIIVMAVHDEATKKLSSKSKEMIKALGSSKIDEFGYRDNWMMVSQKGIRGFTPYEKLSFREGSGWGRQLGIKECIPFKIKGEFVVEALVNKKRENFCKSYDSYPDLCKGENMNKTLKPVGLDDMALRSNPAYKMPIVVVPGGDLMPLQKCLSSLIAVPGLKPSNVLVFLTGNYPEPNELVKLYDFNSEAIKPKSDYSAFLYDAIKRAFELLKDKEYVLVLEDYLEVTPDFLRYFSQVYHLLAKDPTILTVSAWNPNGFHSTSGDESLLYRTQDFPGFGWIARRSVWTDKAMAYKECCNQPTWRGWSLGSVAKGETIIPDVSRVKRIPRTGGYYEDKRLQSAMFHNRMSSSASFQAEPTNVYKLVEDSYELEMKRLVSSSLPLKPSSFSKCLKGGELSLELDTNDKNSYAVFYAQDKAGDQKLLRQLCKCFGLFVFEDFPLFNLHYGIVRFTYRGQHVILVGDKTDYFSLKPTSAEILGSTDSNG